jgi:hypothetical protein
MQAGHEMIGADLSAHTDLFLNTHDLLTGLDTNSLGDHQITANHALLSI